VLVAVGVVGGLDFDGLLDELVDVLGGEVAEPVLDGVATGPDDPGVVPEPVEQAASAPTSAAIKIRWTRRRMSPSCPTGGRAAGHTPPARLSG